MQTVQYLRFHSLGLVVDIPVNMLRHVPAVAVSTIAVFGQVVHGSWFSAVHCYAEGPRRP